MISEGIALMKRVHVWVYEYVLILFGGNHVVVVHFLAHERERKKGRGTVLTKLKSTHVQVDKTTLKHIQI